MKFSLCRNSNNREPVELVSCNRWATGSNDFNFQHCLRRRSYLGIVESCEIFEKLWDHIESRSTPLHLAAKEEFIDYIGELLAWHKHGACAASLNLGSAEPLLNLEAKALLENVLINANKEREKNDLKGTAYLLPSLYILISEQMTIFLRLVIPA
ncbi:hypothetical protein KPL70_003879 [Citrus sinensis]|nr:hypothetical protein KPL70_003879 [Citrus sinensis]